MSERATEVAHTGPPSATFQVDGVDLVAPMGTNLAAALAGAGVATRVSVRGEARGPLCGMGTCFECRVELDGVGEVRACLARITPGCKVVCGAEGRSLASHTDGATRTGGARQATWREETLRCDVAIVGAGPAGVAAAAAARLEGADVVLVDEGAVPGGQIWRVGTASPPKRRARCLVEAAQGTRFVHHASVYDTRVTAEGVTLAVYVAGQAGADGVHESGANSNGTHRGGTLTLHARRLVLATGAIERFLPFPGWTLPGVLGLGGLQALVKGGLDVRGKRVLLAGSGPLSLAVAETLRKRGAHVVALLEQASLARVRRFGLGLWRSPTKLAQGAALLVRLLGVPRHHDAWLTSVVRGPGGLIATGTISAAGRDVRRIEFTDLDHVACAYGLVPATQLGELLGCTRDGDALAVDEELRTSVEQVFAAGEVTGVAGLAKALDEGARAGRLAAREARTPACATTDARPRLRHTHRMSGHARFARGLAAAYALRPEVLCLADDATVVCRCEDVPLGALRGAFGSFREAKLATRAGMGACQGRVCGAACEALFGWPRERPRAPLSPVPLGVLAK